MITIVKADGTSEYELLNRLEARAGEEDRKVTAAVADILANVRANGDAAVEQYTAAFDGVSGPIRVLDREQIRQAGAACDPAVAEALRKAAEHIAAFHQNQARSGFRVELEDGSFLGQQVRGLNRVGVYVPGGTAAYPSSVLMNTIPARIAGVKEILMVTPPPKDGTLNAAVMAAADIAGVDRVYLCGGAQAVAALAYGTETIPRVDKIVGPGNIFVATAKRLVFGQVDIDMVAGPSEILVLADKTAEPAWLAADLLSQAEHDRLASAILLTDSAEVAEQVAQQLDKQMTELSRRPIFTESIENYGAIIVCQNMEQAVAFANRLAPEHLEVMCEQPEQYLPRLENAGSIFLGRYSPEPVGDYFAGPNHVLPTGGTARFFSPLSVDSFIKKSAYICYSETALRNACEDIVTLAEAEGLDAHARAVDIRFRGE